GLKAHPLRFDLTVNLGTLYEQDEQYLEAYHLYMRASYIAKGQDQAKLVIQNLKRIRPYFKGTTQLKLGEEFIIKTSLTYGEKSLIVKTDLNQSKERQLILHTIGKHLSQRATSVLEIEFGSGVISRNLNYYGYDVEAIDSRKGALLELISKEWQENLREPE